MKFTVAVSALLMASAYGFAPYTVSIHQVSSHMSNASPVKVVVAVLPCNIVLT
jgi:hypothetical protein